MAEPAPPADPHARLWARHRAVLPSWAPVYYQEPISLVSGEGRRVRDAAGRSYLDFFGGILTTMTGYNTPGVTEALADQAGKMIHTSTLYLIESQIELAEEVARLSGIPDAKVFFTNSGSEANDLALMLATAYRRSNQVLAMRYSYHGRSFATVPVTGMASWSPSGLSPFQTHYVHGSYPYRSPFKGLAPGAYIDKCVEDLEEILGVACAGDVACLIAEPILGVGGFAAGPDGLFGRFQDVLRARGALFISDEVQTGWGRTGTHYWGYQAHGAQPDIITFAKGVGNGLPLGGVIARGEVMEAFKALSISTFGGNPLITRGALANLHYHRTHDLQGVALRVGAVLRAGLEALARDFPVIGEVRGKGLMQALELVAPGGSAPNPAAAGQLLEAAKRNGLLIGKGGFYGNVIRLAPPMSLTQEEAEEGLALLGASLGTLHAG